MLLPESVWKFWEKTTLCMFLLWYDLKISILSEIVTYRVIHSIFVGLLTKQPQQKCRFTFFTISELPERQNISWNGPSARPYMTFNS